MKLYEAIVSYSEPCQIALRVAAESETEAVKKLTEEVQGRVDDFKIETIIELAEIQQQQPEPQFEPLPDNVIEFPGNRTKH